MTTAADRTVRVRVEPPDLPQTAETAEFNAYDWLLRRSAEAGPDRRAVVAVSPARGDVELSYRELDELVAAAAAALVAAGVRREERFLLYMADCPELVALFLAGLRIGAVPVPVSTMLTARDLAALVADSLAPLVVASSAFAANAVSALNDAGTAGSRRQRPVWLVVVNDPGFGGPEGDWLQTWPEFLAAGAAVAGPGGALSSSYALTCYDSPGFWLYTSGTTGTPKAAMHRHGSLRDTHETYARDVLQITADDVCFSVAKLFFAYGLGNSLTFPLAAGATTILDAGRPTPAGVARIVKQQRPTLFFAGPTFYSALLTAEIPADTFDSVRLAVSAGESFPAELLRSFRRRFGVEVLDGIGSTEMLHIFLSNRPGRVRPGTTGEPVAGYDLRIVDDDGKLLGADQPGHLTVRGRSSASGYWCRTATSRRVFEGEWTRTGDLYVRDADGYYTFLGRSGDVIKAGGIWVSPVEVEQRLRQHAGVAQAVVVPVLDADGLEKPVACVVPMPGADLDEAGLIEFCKEGLASFKRPRRVFVLDAFPLTGSGKVARARLRQLASGWTQTSRVDPAHDQSASVETGRIDPGTGASGDARKP